MHLQRGDPVHVALVTLGEAAGDAGERLAESRTAAHLLGLTEASCLNAQDGAVADDQGLAARIAECVELVQPRIIYAPSPFEMHPDHVATLHAVVKALGQRRDITLLLYEVNAECMASFLLDITPINPLKRSALEAFASQLDRIDIVEKVDARNRARTVNVDVNGVTHAEAFMEVQAPDVPAIVAQLHGLAKLLNRV